MDGLDSRADALRRQAATHGPATSLRTLLIRTAAVAAILVLLVLGELALSFRDPDTFPRPVFLPKPSSVEEWTDGCNDYSVDYEQRGLFWQRVVYSTLQRCL